MQNTQTKIGEIISVSGNILTVQLLDIVKSNIPIIDGIVYRIGQIGSFLKVPLGYSVLYGIVSQIGAAAIPDGIREMYGNDYEQISNTQWLNMVLVGEQVGTRFVRGVSQSPTTGDPVHIVTISDLDIVYGGFGSTNSIEVGNISISESLTAKIDLNRFVSRHSAVIGSTGSGKSNAVGVLLTSIVKKEFGSARILVIDPHGEYGDVLPESSTIYKVRTHKDDGRKKLYVPFWALPFQELLSIFSGNLSDQNKEYIRQKVVDKKQETAKNTGLQIDTELITADTPIPFSIKQLWFELDDFERQTFKERGKPDTLMELTVRGDAETLVSNQYPPASAGGGSPFLNSQAKAILGFLDSVRIRLKDSRYDFLFEPGPYSPNIEGVTEKGLSELLMEWLGATKPITILDLSDIPSEIMVPVSGTLLKVIYDALFWGQSLPVGGKRQPLLVVLEEAHNYLQAGKDSISSLTVRKIAKEGRKYGVGLVLVTQRPSELDETVLSQCGTIIALRMNNSADRSHIRSAIQDDLHTIVDLLPSLRTGEAIISGEGVKIPSRIQFHKLSNAPKSADPLPSECWMEQRCIDKHQYDRLVELWQSQRLEE